MTNRNVIFVALLTLLLVFVLSLAWEFLAEGVANATFGTTRVETAREHWEYVITSTVFAAIAVFISAMVTKRIITERERAETAFRNLFNLQQTLIDAIPIPIFFKDGNAIYQGCNTAFEGFIGMPREEVVGKGVYDVAPKDLADVYYAADRELLDKGGVQVYEATVKYADGSYHDVVFHKAVFEKADGSLGGLVGAMLDITDHKETEVVLRNSEQKFKDFASDAAHELRTPLSVLKLRLDDLEESETAQILHKEVEDMSRLLEQLLAIMRLESPEALVMERVDIRKICTNVAERLAPLAIRDERSIEVTGSEGPVIITGNANALEHAVRNLVENALKYSSRQTTVSIEVNSAPYISVINEGIGIPPVKRKTIFERFQRSDRRSGGAGLGLSIVQRAVEAHKGNVEVADAYGGSGARFTIHL